MKRHMERCHNRSYEDYDSNMPLTKKPRTSDEESVDNDSSTDSEYESSTDSEHDSSTDSEHDSTLETSTESSAEDESDTDFLNDDEFASYRKIFDSFMMKVYKDTYDEVMDTNEDVSNIGVNQQVLDLASKAFRKQLTKMMIMINGLFKDERYVRLNKKIRKYLNDDLDIQSAYPMAVKAASELFNDDFKESVNRLLDDESSSGEETDEESSSGEEADDERSSGEETVEESSSGEETDE